MFRRIAGAAVTGRLAFLLSGLIDLALALPALARYLLAGSRRRSAH
jgi:hypothetical protein